MRGQRHCFIRPLDHSARLSAILPVMMDGTAARCHCRMSCSSAIGFLCPGLLSLWHCPRGIALPPRRWEYVRRSLSLLPQQNVQAVQRSRLTVGLAVRYKVRARLSTGRSWVGYARLDLRFSAVARELPPVRSWPRGVTHSRFRFTLFQCPFCSSHHLHSSGTCSDRSTQTGEATIPMPKGLLSQGPRNLIVGKWFTGPSGDVLPSFPSRESRQWTP